MGGIRTPARGPSGTSSTLETVQEISQPNTPALGIDGALEKAEHDLARLLNEHENPIDNAFSKTLKAREAGGLNDSGSDSGGKGEIKMRANSVAHVILTRPAGPTAKAYSASAAVGRGKPSGEGSTRNMTVETETVSSIPQVAVGVGPAAGGNGSIRAKPSSETIRPKKEKKKTARKTASVTSGIGELYILLVMRTLCLGSSVRSPASLYIPLSLPPAFMDAIGLVPSNRGFQIKPSMRLVFVQSFQCFSLETRLTPYSFVKSRYLRSQGSQRS